MQMKWQFILHGLAEAQCPLAHSVRIGRALGILTADCDCRIWPVLVLVLVVMVMVMVMGPHRGCIRSGRRAFGRAGGVIQLPRERGRLSALCVRHCHPVLPLLSSLLNSVPIHSVFPIPVENAWSGELRTQVEGTSMLRLGPPPLLQRVPHCSATPHCANVCGHAQPITPTLGPSAR